MEGDDDRDTLERNYLKDIVVKGKRRMKRERER